MGLDCIPMGKAMTGHEAEWQGLMDKLYADEELPEEHRERLIEISLHPYQNAGAPVVGTDPEADAWVIENKAEDNELSDDEFVEEMKGYCVLDLVPDTCPGLPRYTHSGLYDEVDATSFRGAFLNDCEDIIGNEALVRAWTNVMPPQDAIEYGNLLLEAARNARENGVPAPEKQGGLLGRLKGLTGSKTDDENDTPLEDKIDILEAAGNWYVFWGERGHPIWAYY